MLKLLQGTVETPQDLIYEVFRGRHANGCLGFQGTKGTPTFGNTSTKPVLSTYKAELDLKFKEELGLNLSTSKGVMSRFSLINSMVFGAEHVLHCRQSCHKERAHALIIDTHYLVLRQA
jgi:hypothetical protein